MPTNHELFLSQTEAELYQEMTEDMLFSRQEIRAQLENEDTPIADRSNLWKRLHALDRALGNPTESQDPLIDEWERDLEEGRMPNLDKQQVR